ncbi:MAG: 16S rRNA (guanine(966)-N(2))-methyltransferase RsmD [Rhizobiaceae bacterium]
MRIVGGRLRGRKLAEPKTQDIRPTTDRNRESLFNILNHHWPEKLDGTRVLDVFAGTGALGCEALSRGAAFAVFIEQGVEGRGLLRQNIEALGLTGHTKVFRRDALKPGIIGTLEPFDLVFADPPYGKGLGEKAIAALVENGWLKPSALLVLEEQKNHMPNTLNGFRKTDERSFGESAFGLFQLVTET